MANLDKMAVRDQDGTYTLYELEYEDDPDDGRITPVRKGLSKTEAERVTGYVLDEPPESHLLG